MGEGRKNCIIMQFFRRKPQKVHYSALLGAGKRQEKLLIQSLLRLGEVAEQNQDDTPASKCAVVHPSSQLT
jgi:hypothetical protein